jgi:outer membrane protein assembly factor BamE (lipoprotein component of BamABCDE complex)
MMRSLLPAALAAVLIALSGCATIGRPFDEAQISRFEVGRTTEADVVAALGPPAATASGPTVRAMSYSYTHAYARPASYVPLIGPLIGGANATNTSVSFIFTPAGVLQSWSRAGANIRTGGI